MARYLGIDFSGSVEAWRPRRSRAAVWIATVEDRALVDLRPVQALPGSGDCFDRMVDLLGAGDFAAAAIDAPFSLPARHLPSGRHAALLDAVAALPLDGRPFPTGAAVLALAETAAPLESAKPMRATERGWGVATRSTLWNGPRGGAPFAAACVTLLSRAHRPVWPWSAGPGMLVEAFPAAQLRRWGLPHQRYNGPDERVARRAILAGLAERLAFDGRQAETMLDNADALDAAVAAFGAIAAVEGRFVRRDHPLEDGLIAVHDDPETVTDLLRHPHARIERIVSRGHVTPADAPYRQDRDEWVILLSGAARLWLGDAGERTLAPGDHLLIPAGTIHRVTWTPPDQDTVWLAVHLGPESC